jgi:hypothetical protein
MTVTREHHPLPRCPCCGQILGVYEPLVLMLPDRSTRRTSRLAAGGLPPDALVVHESCYGDRRAARDPVAGG